MNVSGIPQTLRLKRLIDEKAEATRQAAEAEDMASLQEARKWIEFIDHRVDTVLESSAFYAELDALTRTYSAAPSQEKGA